MTALGVVLTVLVSFSGCGGDGGTAAVETAKPDAGLEASKSIMQMQPPGPAGAGKKKAGRN